jgi:ATP-dependent DNA helicase RecG
MSLLDLEELSQRESERVEWKENVADIESVVKTAVAFANDYSNLGGGYIVCGASEIKDKHGFPAVNLVGLTSSRLKEVEGKVLTLLRERVSPPIVPLTEEIKVSEEGRVLIFTISCTGKAHSFRSAKSGETSYLIRVGRETREARNGLLLDLLRDRSIVAPWDKRTNENASVSDIDLIMLRSYLQEMKIWDDKKNLDAYLSAVNSISAHIPPLLTSKGINPNLKPRNFSLLMFANEPLYFFKGAFSYLSIYHGKDRSESFASRHEINGSVVQQAKKLIDILSIELKTFFNKESPVPNQVRYPKRALQEAIVNCLVHRDYEIDQPVRITIFSDRIEFYSPGSLSNQIDKEKFIEGTATPYWRNQTLAYFFNKLQLSQAEGQGIPTILRTLKEEGCPKPLFEFGTESVTCTLYPNPMIKE